MPTFPSAARLLLIGTCLTSALTMQAKADPLATLDRNGSLVAIEPYAPNIVRVTIALDRALADAAAGRRPQRQARRDRLDAPHATPAATCSPRPRCR